MGNTFIKKQINNNQNMIYKIVFEDEIHRVRSKVTTLKELKALITSKFGERVP